MTDLTAAVEAAARALHEAAVAKSTEPDQAPSWDELPMLRQQYREHVLPAVAAAAPILRAQVLAEAREAVASARDTDNPYLGTEVGRRVGIDHALDAIDALEAEATR